MKNRLKGITLVETMLYIGLFSAIIIIVLNFMLSTQEATQRTNIRNQLNTTSEFISQHMNYTFNKTIAINNTSIFNNDQGLLDIQLTEGNKQYSISNSRIYFDGTPITPSNILVTKFLVEPVYKGTDTIIGIRTEITLVSKQDSKLTETINLLSLIR